MNKKKKTPKKPTATGDIVYIPGKRRAYRLEPGKPLPPELELEVNVRAKKLADQLAHEWEQRRITASTNQVAPSVSEFARDFSEKMRCWSPAQQNLILATVIQRISNERKNDLKGMERMEMDAAEQSNLLRKSVNDLQKIASGEFLILH
jgi:hypothetical protein